ncbi:MAG: AraC family transcriptional regulator [Pseudomonadota bacterium]
MTDAVKRTLWKIEHRIADPLTLGGLAAEVGMSPYQLARAFPMRTGWPVMRYLRARRLTEAAKLIAAGSPILEAAFDVGYTTHEAFTRAFTDRFGIPPRDARSADRLATLDLVETIVMKDAAVLIPPRRAMRPAFRVAGAAKRYTFAETLAIPALWTRFEEIEPYMPKPVAPTSYGVMYDGDDDGFTYLAGVEVPGDADLPPEAALARVPAQTYAVFTHDGHISDLRDTVTAVWSTGLSEAGFTHRPGPDFEVYDARFDPVTGEGLVEIWIPIEG